METLPSSGSGLTSEFHIVIKRLLFKSDTNTEEDNFSYKDNDMDNYNTFPLDLKYMHTHRHPSTHTHAQVHTHTSTVTHTNAHTYTYGQTRLIFNKSDLWLDLWYL